MGGVYNAIKPSCGSVRLRPLAFRSTHATALQSELLLRRGERAVRLYPAARASSANADWYASRARDSCSVGSRTGRPACRDRIILRSTVKSSLERRFSALSLMAFCGVATGFTGNNLLSFLRRLWILRILSLGSGQNVVGAAFSNPRMILKRGNISNAR